MKMRNSFIYIIGVLTLTFLTTCKKENIHNNHSEELNYLCDSSFIYEFEGDDSVLVCQTYYNYNQLGQITQKRIVNTDRAFRTVFEEKYEFEYDVQGNKTMEIYYYRQQESGLWINYTKNIWEYNLNGEVILSEDYIGNGLNVWVGNFRYETKSLNGDTLEDINSEWDFSLNNWGYDTKNDYVIRKNIRFNTKSCFWKNNTWETLYTGKIEERNDSIRFYIYNYDINTKEIISSGLNVYVFDEYENVILKMLSDNSSINVEGVFSSKFEYKYDQEGRIILELRSDWDESSDSWVYYNKYESEYDAFGNKILFIRYAWDEYGNRWIGQHKNVLQINSEGNVEIYYNYFYDVMQDNWYPERERHYLYDLSGNETMTSEYKYNYSPIEKLLLIRTYNYY